MMNFINSALYSFAYELKQAYLSLKQKPLFVFSVVSTMGITLGALLCVLTLAYVMLIKPLPYPEQDRLYVVEQSQIDQSQKENVRGFSYPAIVDFYQNQNILSKAALVDYGESALASHAKSPTINTIFVTPEWFSLLNAKAIKGRLFEQSESINTFNPVAIISYKVWQQHFNSDKNILGQSIFTQNQHYTIVGVMSKNFIEPQLRDTDKQSDIWLPWDFNPTPDNLRKRWWGRMSSRTLIGSLSANLFVKQAEKQSSIYVNNTWQEKITSEKFFDGWHVEIKLIPFIDKIIGNSKQAVYILLASAIGLLLIASLNLTNLYYARFSEKEREISIHAALGAKKQSILKSILIENILLFSLSIFIALAISSLNFTLLQFYLHAFLPRVDELKLQAFTLFSGVVLSCLLLLVFSSISINTINFKQLASKFMNAGKGVSNQIPQRTQKALIFSQITIAMTLVFLCVLIGYKAIKMTTFNDGMDANNLQSLQIRMQADTLPSTEAMHELVTQVKITLEQRPGVIKVSRTTSPYVETLSTWSLTETSSLKQVLPLGKRIDDAYFSMTGQKLIQGRTFTKDETRNNSNVLIINDVLAELISPADKKVIGKKLSFDISGGDKYALPIIGVVSNYKVAGETAAKPQVYKPSNSLFSLLILTKKDQQLSKKDITQVLADISSIFKIYRLESVMVQKEKKLFAHYIAITISITLLLLTIALAALGLYGILSYSTQMRRFEIGTRMAIGAKRGDVIRLIIKDNTKAILLGIAVSVLLLIILALSFSEQLASYLTWQLIPLFLITLGLVSLISFAACYLPLRQYINNPAMYSLRGSE
jgi:putative ABC transport system permease protein